LYVSLTSQKGCEVEVFAQSAEQERKMKKDKEVKKEDDEVIMN